MPFPLSYFYYSPLPINMARAGQVQRSAQTKKENVNHKNGRELQKVIYLRLPQPQNVHKSSQISTMSVSSTEINLLKERDSETRVRNAAQRLWKQHARNEEGRAEQRAKLSCCSEIPVSLQESLQPKFGRRPIILWSWHWMDYHTKFWNTCSGSNLKPIRNNCVWLLENVVKFNPHPNATWAVSTGNCFVLLWLTSSLTLSSNCYSSWKLKQN